MKTTTLLLSLALLSAASACCPVCTAKPPQTTPPPQVEGPRPRMDDDDGPAVDGVCPELGPDGYDGFPDGDG